MKVPEQQTGDVQRFRVVFLLLPDTPAELHAIAHPKYDLSVTPRSPKNGHIEGICGAPVARALGVSFLIFDF